MSAQIFCKTQCRDRARYQDEKYERKEYAIQYYWTDPEHSRAYAANYRHQGRESRTQWFARRREQERIDRIPLTPKEWERMKSRFNHCCAYCGIRPEKLEMDHVVPLSRGGRHRPSNILPACPPCNRSKRAMFLSEWRPAKKKRLEVTPPL